MILKPGEKIHVIHRRFYEDDTRRQFVGTVEIMDGNLARVSGYLFTIDSNLNQFVRGDAIRTRIIPLSSGSVIVNVIPDDVDIENVRYEYRNRGNTVVTDGSEWALEISHL